MNNFIYTRDDYKLPRVILSFSYNSMPTIKSCNIIYYFSSDIIYILVAITSA
jgi:hypothetical protein